MGTIISDNSHFTAFNLNFIQCQATVILTGFHSLFFAFQLLIRNFCPDPSFPVCYHLDSGWSVLLHPELLPYEILADGAPS